jgi:hypothetical protein
MTRNRIFTLIWLIISQLGSGILAIVPLVLVGALGTLIAGGGAFQYLGWTLAFVCGITLILFALTIASWIAFFRKKDKVAAILSGIHLLIGAGLFVALNILLPTSS